MVIKTPEQIEFMRKGGRILADTLKSLAKEAAPGTVALDLSKMAEKLIRSAGGEPSFLGHNGFPAAMCISINSEVVHGIPDQRRLQDGDIVGMDLGVTYKGLIVDATLTIGVGNLSKEATRLLTATQEALDRGIGAVKPGALVSDISRAIEARLKQDNLGIIEELSGHGVGLSLHEEPIIPNFYRPGANDTTLVLGMTLAIEPMATLGGKQVTVRSDGWTFVTVDGSLAAQFEHTVLVTEDGCEVLTE